MTDKGDTVDTAFLIIRHEDGSYSATTDLSDIPAVSRKPNIYDIKHGCAEIMETIQLQALRSVVSTTMSEMGTSEGEKVSQAIRQSLQEKGLL